MDGWAEVRGVGVGRDGKGGEGGRNGWTLVPDIDLQRLNLRVSQINVFGTKFGIGFVSCELSLEDHRLCIRFRWGNWVDGRVNGGSLSNQKVTRVFSERLILMVGFHFGLVEYLYNFPSRLSRRATKMSHMAHILYNILLITLGLQPLSHDKLWLSTIFT